MHVGSVKAVLAPLTLTAFLAACSPGQPDDAGEAKRPQGSETPAAPAAPPPATTEPAADGPLADVAESDPRYVIGISFPRQANAYPGMVKVLGDYAQSARAELMQAVNGLDGQKPSAPYELSLSFDVVADTPEIFAVAADGGRYTGGAHGEPLVARFTWLPNRQALLTTQEMLPTPAGLQAASQYVREQLHTSASLRVDDDTVPPDQRMQLLDSENQMIDAGTAPEVSNFSLFQPVMNADGKIAAVRFVFPPYQVGSYADGTQTVDVPAPVLRPYLAPEYADLFLK